MWRFLLDQTVFRNKLDDSSIGELKITRDNDIHAKDRRECSYLARWRPLQIVRVREDERIAKRVPEKYAMIPLQGVEPVVRR